MAREFTIDANDGVITDYNENAPGVTGTGTTTTENNSCGPTSTVYGTVDTNTSGGLVVSGGMNTITVAKVTSTRNDDNGSTSL